MNDEKAKLAAETWQRHIHLQNAAPDLYEALEILAKIPIEDFGIDSKVPDERPLTGWNNVTLTIGHIRKARAALAKARGEA